MANFNEAVLTRKGIGLLAKAQAGQTGIKLTKAAAGNGSYEEGESLVEKEALKDQRQEFPIDKLSVQNSTTVSVRFTITNEQATGNLQEGYRVKEVGIFAEDPDGGEILYAIATTVEGQWDYMPAYSSLLPAYISVEFYVEVSNAASVTIVCSGRFITAEEVEAELEKLREQIGGLSEIFVTIKKAETEHTAIKKLIQDVGKVPEGVLTEEDKGVANGVASLDSGGRIPRTQLPDDSGAMYLGDKLSFKDLTWRAVESAAGWVGTYTSPYKDTDGRFSDLLIHIGRSNRMLDVFFSPDISSLYSRYTTGVAERLACAFCNCHHRAFLGIDSEGTCTIKVFSDSDLGQSGGSGTVGLCDVTFWPFVIRTGQPSY